MQYYFTHAICKIHMILGLPIRNASCNSIIVILQINLMLNKIMSENVSTYTQQNVGVYTQQIIMDKKIQNSTRLKKQTFKQTI
jgi:hypothetical protein